MTNIVTIQKTITSEAVKVDSPEADALVRQWLVEMFQVQLDGITQVEAEDLARAQVLTPIVEAGAYFARDNGDKTVFIIPPEDFASGYVEVGATEIPALVTDSFSFENKK